MAEPMANELNLYEILHHPIGFMEFVTPVDTLATKVMPMQDWLKKDAFGKVRLYQLPTLGWDHLLPSEVPIDSGGLEVDRVSAGTSYDWGGRNTSKSFGIEHDVLQDPLIRKGEMSLLTSRDGNHLAKRVDAIWKYIARHPLYRPLIRSAKRGDPYASVTFWNGHVLKGIMESTVGAGDSYLASHFHRANIDEFQMTSAPAWEKLSDAVSETGCVMRGTGVSDGRVDTPAHDTRNSPSFNRFVHTKPQHLNPLVWTPAKRRQASETYGGEDSQGYLTNVLAEEGEPVSSVWDLSVIRSCIATFSEDKHRSVELRRKVQCPVVRIIGKRIKGVDDKETIANIAEIEFPPDLDSTMDVWLSLDVGKRMHPTVIGIWGINKDFKPHLWGMAILLVVDYDDQSLVLRHMIDRYGVTHVGIDATGRGGDAIVEHLVKWRSEEDGLHIVPVRFNSVVIVPETIKEKRIRKKDKKKPDRKLGIKYFSTVQLQLRFQRQFISLLFDMGTLVEFQGEVAKRSTGRLTTIPETYFGSKGDHRIDMMRVLEMMLFEIATVGKRHRKRRSKKPYIGRMGKL